MTQKNICIQLFFALFIACVTSCKKGEYIENPNLTYKYIEFERVGEANISQLLLNGKPLESPPSSRAYQIPFHGEDSLALTLVYGKNTLTKKFDMSKAYQSYYLFAKGNNIDSLAILTNHPMDGVEVPDDNSFYLNIYNENKYFSPDGSPIHIALYDGVGEWNQWDPTYTENPVDTIFNITTQFNEGFRKIKYLNYYSDSGVGNWKAKVLREDKTPVKSPDGNDLYFYIPFSKNVKVLYTYIDNKEIKEVNLDNWDSNSYMELPNGAVSTLFPLKLYLSK
ncbi:hypothetical protein [Sphingobacterium lactis]|uniref:hypothetical protein n=1 Tax=Sphingobacterium lactis TaxID=797291 RepID=UPI003DA4BA24